MMIRFKYFNGLSLSYLTPIQAYLIISGAVFARKKATISIENTITIVPRVIITLLFYLNSEDSSPFL